MPLKVRILQFLTPFTQLTAKLKNFLWGLMLVLGLKKGLLECATVFIKSEFILMQAYDYNTKTLLLCVWNSICIIWMFLVFLNLWSLFFCVFFFLLIKCSSLQKSNYFTMFFPILSTHSDAFLSYCFWKYICISFGIFFTTKNFCFCLMEVPHYGRKA